MARAGQAAEPAEVEELPFKLRVQTHCVSASALPGYEIVTVKDYVAGSAERATTKKSCPSGKKAFGAGWTGRDMPGYPYDLKALRFSSDGTEWTLTTAGKSPAIHDVILSVICATAGN